MEDEKFLKAVQVFLANSISISTVRRMGPTGTLARIRQFLKEEVDLKIIGESDPAHFQDTLNDLTAKLRRRLSPESRHWGVARKCLNLFFRDALYNYYLRNAYGLKKFEPYMEIPLDSNVGRRLRKEDRSLPAWRTVKGLTPELSARFQKAAAQIAKRDDTCRVHLDVKYWRGDPP
jgi:N-glycosylase/DNA lyase